MYACGGPGRRRRRTRSSPSADANMDAYSICPPGASVGTGIVTKATSNGGVAAYFAGAYQVFTAPPGASLQSVSFDVGAIRLDDYWSVGIVAFDSDTDPGVLPYGCYAVPGRLRHRHAHVQPSHHRASVPPCEVPLRDALRRPGWVSDHGERVQSRATAHCSRPRTYPCVSTTGPNRR